MTASDGPSTPALLTGRPAPLGATCLQTDAGDGVNFAIWSGAATRVELCVFDGQNERRYRLPVQTHGVWHGFLPGAGPGLAYAYRVHGEYDPLSGKRFNANKLLLDPYARMLTGQVIEDDRLLDYRPGSKRWRMDTRDSAPAMPRCVVVEDQFDWQGAQPPATRLADTIVYELHVKGFTRLHPEVPEALRGTYLGLAEPAVTGYLQRLGITAIELLPCASFVSESSLVQRGLSNYWGYNTIGFFAPHSGYARENPVTEFQTMVRAMHQAGIEVFVDVVYNHTAEGAAPGPTLSFRGIDNAAYYQLGFYDRSSYINNSGCGNSLAVDKPHVLKLVLDSLRYWVEVLHVDGFRFDLGPSLARVNGEFDPRSAFFQAIYQDPVLSQVKLFAEPWDVGHAGYRLGQFPPGWSEWNDRYRSTVRSFWRGDDGVIGELASRISGSSDVFGQRGPGASLNYVTAHDGFSLQDLVSYALRHNEDNGENNNDGDGHNYSWNHGIEGPASDPRIQARRDLDKRALLATLMFSQGVPMLLAGDELGRTQQGNNNAYCQDNEISWVDWQQADQWLIDFVARLIVLRREHEVFRRQEHLVGTLNEPAKLHDVEWLTPAGRPMEASHWQEPQRRVLAVLLRGLNDPAIESRYKIDSDNALMLINGSDEPVNFEFPIGTGPWDCVLDSNPEGSGGSANGANSYGAAAGSLVLLISPQ